jgi:class 3 adenylate cyclase/tetratricopeptide (TPR) repeat protein
MTCADCGTTLPSGAKFCAECGTPVAAACRACGTELLPGQKFCPQCGTPTAPPAAAGGSAPTGSVAAAPLAERRMTSVLFGDLVGFTTLSESRDPEEVRELLGRYFDTARGIIARYGGTIEKFIGDAVMAVWGVPTAHEDDAERAVRAGIDLTESVAAFGESVGAPGLAMRVGIVTGEVAVTIGATGQGMVAGDAVNTASRVQAKADPGTVWVDAQTRSLTGGSIDFAEAGTHELKGKSEPVELFAATAVMGGVGGERSTDRVQAPLVGRRREISVLKEMFHVAEEERRPRLVILSGDAGVGKTRLGWELENYIDGLSAEVLWHRGRCLAYGDGVAFSALTAAVRGRIGAGEDDAEPAVRDKLTASLGTYVPDEAERSRLFRVLSSLVGLSGASAGLTRPELFSGWLTWFERLSQHDGDPVVWVVDDAHYADDGLLDFIEHLATVAQTPLLIVLLARPELLARRPGLAALRRATVIGLETLSRTDVAALFDELVEGLPTDLRDALVDRAEGNPLFAIETVRAMHDQGLAVGGPTRRPGAVRVAPGVDAAALGALAAPASLQLLVASRLDLLPPRERALLAAASVLGQTFGVAAAQAVSGMPGDELDEALHELVGRDLLTVVTDRLSAEEGQYAFVQSVVRTVAYQTQSKRDRLERHLAAVAHLESLADSDSELNTVISQHLRDAAGLIGLDDPQRTEIVSRLGTWLERSADRSVAVGAPGDALRALIEAIELADDAAHRIRLRIAAARAALSAGELEQCVELAMPVAAGDLGAAGDQVAQAIFAVANALRVLGRLDDGWQLLEPYLEPAAVEGMSAAVAAPLVRQVSVYLQSLGRLDEAAVSIDRALGFAEDSGDSREQAQSLIVMAIVHMIRGHTGLALAIYSYAAEFAREHQLVFELGMALGNMAAAGINRDPIGGLAAAEQSAELQEQAGFMPHLWVAMVNEAIILVNIGRWDELDAIVDRPSVQGTPPPMPLQSVIAFQRAQVAIARGSEVDIPTLEKLAEVLQPGQLETLDDMFYLACGAAVAKARGDAAGVVAACRRLVESAYRHNQLEDDFPSLWNRAVDWTIEAGDIEAARAELAPVADAAPARLSPVLAAQLPRLRATIEAADPASSADPGRTETDLLEAIAALDRLGMVPDRARAQATLGRWLDGHGRRAEAEPYLAAARTTFTELRAHGWLRDLDGTAALSAAGASSLSAAG